jgi:hypothetical protein
MRSLGDRYKDVASERGRLKWARRCALGIGDYVFGERGARRGPNPELIDEKKAGLRDAEERHAETDAQLTTLEQEVTNGGAAQDATDILLALVRMTALARELGSRSQTLERARNELSAARMVEVPVGDEMTAAQLLLRYEDPDFGSDDREEEGEAEVSIVRHRASLEEFQWALGGRIAVSEVTLRRWARGEKTRLAVALGLPEGVRGVNEGRPACIERVSPRRQWILLDQLDWSRFPTAVQENFAAICRTPEPVR